jgi:hypothetical protein
MRRPNDGQYLLPSLFLPANSRISPPMKSSIGSTVLAFDYSLILEFGCMQRELMRASINKLLRLVSFSRTLLQSKLAFYTGRYHSVSYTTLACLTPPLV